jgi:hypothetical protein
MDGIVTVEEATARRGDVFAMFDMNEDGLLDAEEYVLFDETRALDMENNGGHGRGAMVQASEGMTLPFNDVDADGAVSLAEFLGQAPAWIAAWTATATASSRPPISARTAAETTLSGAPGNRAHHQRKGDHRMGLKASASTAAGFATCPNRRFWRSPFPRKRTTPASTAAMPTACAPTIPTAPPCSTRWRSRRTATASA